MSSRADVVVLGGGIAGLSVALAAADRGMRVTLADDRRPGAASRTSAGLLAPSIHGLPSGARDIAIAARDLYPAWLAALRERSGMEVPLDRGGILEVAADDAELASIDARGAAAAARLDARALAALEPALTGRAGALLHPHDGAVDIARLMTALDRGVALETRITRVAGAAAALELASADATLVMDDGSRYRAARVVLASGAWATQLDGLPRILPLFPLRGQLLRVAADVLRHVTFAGSGYLAPRDGQLLVGATSERAGFHAETTLEGLRALHAIASRAVPALSDATVAAHWAGLRPMTPDGLPILGADPDHPALVYACGYSRNGILLAPWAADRLAELLVGETPRAELLPFAIERAGLRSDP